MTEEALLQALHENPADGATRLILADWLEENGDARAPLMRLLEELRGLADGPDREDKEQRVRDLLANGVRPCVPEVVNSIGMRFALIPPGTFHMGSPPGEKSRYDDEGPRHHVTLTKPFYMGVHLVTQAQFQRVMGDNPSGFRAGGRSSRHVRKVDTKSFPVDSQSWIQSVEFCRRLGARPAEKKAGRTYRLATEAEWEYACRGGHASRAPFHFGYTASSHQANFDGTNPYGDAEQGPHLRRPCPVGMYPPNGFGLYDMHGNLWEWCADWFDEDLYRRKPRIDPTGSADGDERVMRGGSFFYIGSSCRAAIRLGREPEDQSNLDGFRVVLNWPVGG